MIFTNSERLFGRLLALGLVSLLWVFNSPAMAQDTIRVMQYNLFRYGESGKEPSFKNPLLKTIVDYVQPDIIGTNEISGTADYAQNILTGCLNSNGETKWARSSLSKAGADKSLSNSLFFDKNKFKLLKQDTVSTVQREITAFRLLYLDSNLALTRDSIFFNVMVLHFKAGNTSSDATTRALEADQIRIYLNGLGKQENIVIMGDYNVYTSSEVAYQHLVVNADTTNRMFDPINRPGNWNNNSIFQDIHTQSTHTTQTGGFSSGGMDDRFDVLLCSRALMRDSLKMRVLPSSYVAVGNDGLRFNMALTDPPANTSVPSSVLGALYNMSDHLPIRCDFVLSPSKPLPQSVPSKKKELEESLYLENPVHDFVNLYFRASAREQMFDVYLYNSQGSLLHHTEVNGSEVNWSLAWNPNWATGFYFVRVQNKQGWAVERKIVKH